MLLTSPLSWIYWDPPRDAFTIPYFDLPVAWYGILFAAGFVVGYFILIPMLRQVFAQSRKLDPQDDQVKALATTCADHLTWFIVIGTVVGARLGHVFFYDWPYYSSHPLEIIMIRKGGLASHGGTLGVIVGLILFLWWNRKQFPEFTLIKLFDILVVPTAFTVFCIRLGNFFNQEILGDESTLPWAIIFGHPTDGASSVPRHPAQLYEGFVYLATFFLLHYLWRHKRNMLKPGFLSGVFFLLVFGSRFLIEFVKMPQSSFMDSYGLQMGQYLSIPFILLGAALLVHARRCKHA